MSKGIDLLVGHAIICGFGRVGQMLASDLAAARQSLVILDSNADRVAQAQAAGHLAILGSASEETTLEEAGIGRARVLAAVLPDDTANVFITLTARDLNATLEIIARAESPATERKLMRSGANRVVLPALIGATKIANMIVRPSAEDMLLEASGMMALAEDLTQIGLTLTEIELPQSSPLVGHTVGDVELSGGFVVVAIKRADASLHRAPESTVTLMTGDSFVILGHLAAVPQLARRARPATTMYRGAKT